MATDKLFTVAGVSSFEDETKVRFANDLMRTKVLTKNGHTNIILVSLPEPMSKVDAAKFIQTHSDFQDVFVQATISEYLDKNTVSTAPKKPRAKSVKTEDPVTEMTETADDDKPIGYDLMEAAE